MNLPPPPAAALPPTANVCPPQSAPPPTLLLQLRDGRKIVGTLRSFDQFANLVLSGGSPGLRHATCPVVQRRPRLWLHRRAFSVPSDKRASQQRVGAMVAADASPCDNPPASQPACPTRCDTIAMNLLCQLAGGRNNQADGPLALLHQ